MTLKRKHSAEVGVIQFKKRRMKDLGLSEADTTDEVVASILNASLNDSNSPDLLMACSTCNRMEISDTTQFNSRCGNCLQRALKLNPRFVLSGVKSLVMSCYIAVTCPP